VLIRRDFKPTQIARLILASDDILWVTIPMRPLRDERAESALVPLFDFMPLDLVDVQRKWVLKGYYRFALL
jgi:hypothetical protein